MNLMNPEDYSGGDSWEGALLSFAVVAVIIIYRRLKNGEWWL